MVRFLFSQNAFICKKQPFFLFVCPKSREIKIPYMAIKLLLSCFLPPICTFLALFKIVILCFVIKLARNPFLGFTARAAGWPLCSGNS